MMGAHPSRSLRALLVAGALAWSGIAGAVDTPPSDALPDLAPIRALVYSGNYAKAASELEKLATTVRHADVFNLLGYSLRNLGRFEEADKWYREALYYNPEHLAAIEYQGELFLQTGRLEKAEENLVTLRIYCPKGCRERTKLEEAIQAAKSAGKSG